MSELSLSTADNAAIRALIQQMQDGWNAHDGAAFAAPFAADADYIVVNGTHIRGREAIEAGHVQIFNTLYHNSQNQLTVEQIRLLREDVAIAHVRAQLTVTISNVTERNNARFSIVAVRNENKWEIAAFQNTPIQEPRK